MQSRPIRDPAKYVYPEAARRRGIDGSTLLLAHVDASGWVCMLGVVHSSGFDDLDERAMRTAAQLRFEPVQVQGRPVEYLRFARVGFSLGMDFRK
ncbi:MAG TPA: energy transducer TonB [Steroidobacteraceae bacterium]|nr:energy transducer TonB [Steroidobacteraceae bacterium]